MNKLDSGKYFLKKQLTFFSIIKDNKGINILNYETINN